jgi:hypothetical protein
LQHDANIPQQITKRSKFRISWQQMHDSEVRSDQIYGVCSKRKTENIQAVHDCSPFLKLKQHGQATNMHQRKNNLEKSDE